MIKNNDKNGKLKSYYVKTFGCQMNEHDTEKLSGMLEQMGYCLSGDEKNADIIIYNTCCVRQNAEEKVFGHVGALKTLKRENPHIIIAVCGCMMQQEHAANEIKKTYRHVDLVFGTYNRHKLPEYINRILQNRRRIFDVWDENRGVTEGIPAKREEKYKAWVTIMYGCNNFCSYCIVPYVRGRERSRKPENIVNEVKALANIGVKEITLLGQNVNSYGKDLKPPVEFSELLYMLNEIKGMERIRFMTPHPKDISEKLIDAIKNLKSVCEHLHLPLQSGSTDILKSMNRKYTKGQYLDIVERAKAKIPDLSLTTDIIVGFPGETDEDFGHTLDVVKKSGFDMAYTFLYSKRKGTPAAKMENQVPDIVKKERFSKLLEVQNSISYEKNKLMYGKTVEILVEGLSKNSIHSYTGRTRGNKIVNFEADKDYTGKLINIKINKIQTWSLEGSIENG